jgi:hypothetical protein
VADVFQLPVTLPLESESAALGVALQAAAVHRGIPIDEYISAVQTPVAKVSTQHHRASMGRVSMLLCRHVTAWHDIVARWCSQTVRMPPRTQKPSRGTRHWASSCSRRVFDGCGPALDLFDITGPADFESASSKVSDTVNGLTIIVWTAWSLMLL